MAVFGLIMNATSTKAFGILSPHPSFFFSKLLLFILQFYPMYAYILSFGCANEGVGVDAITGESLAEHDFDVAGKTKDGVEGVFDVNRAC